MLRKADRCALYAAVCVYACVRDHMSTAFSYNRKCWAHVRTAYALYCTRHVVRRETPLVDT